MSFKFLTFFDVFIVLFRQSRRFHFTHKYRRNFRKLRRVIKNVKNFLTLKNFNLRLMVRNWLLDIMCNNNQTHSKLPHFTGRLSRRMNNSKISFIFLLFKILLDQWSFFLFPRFIKEGIVTYIETIILCPCVDWCAAYTTCVDDYIMKWKSIIARYVEVCAFTSNKTSFLLLWMLNLYMTCSNNERTFWW